MGVEVGGGGGGVGGCVGCVHVGGQGQWVGLVCW